jgi:hypothetical protein
MIALSVTGSIDLSSTLIFSGLANIITGVVFGVPLPVQPMKAIAAVAISQKFTKDETAAAGLVVSFAVLALSVTGLLHWLHRVVPVPVVKGIQVGAGLSLAISAGSTLIQPLAWHTPTLGSSRLPDPNSRNSHPEISLRPARLPPRPCSSRLPSNDRLPRRHILAPTPLHPLKRNLAPLGPLRRPPSTPSHNSKQHPSSNIPLSLSLPILPATTQHNLPRPLSRSLQPNRLLVRRNARLPRLRRPRWAIPLRSSQRCEHNLSRSHQTRSRTLRRRRSCALTPAFPEKLARRYGACRWSGIGESWAECGRFGGFVG